MDRYYRPYWPFFIPFAAWLFLASVLAFICLCLPYNGIGVNETRVLTLLASLAVSALLYMTIYQTNIHYNYYQILSYKISAREKFLLITVDSMEFEMRGYYAGRFIQETAKPHLEMRVQYFAFGVRKPIHILTAGEESTEERGARG